MVLFESISCTRENGELHLSIFVVLASDSFGEQNDYLRRLSIESSDDQVSFTFRLESEDESSTYEIYLVIGVIAVVLMMIFALFQCLRTCQKYHESKDLQRRRKSVGPRPFYWRRTLRSSLV